MTQPPQESQQPEPQQPRYAPPPQYSAPPQYAPAPQAEFYAVPAPAPGGHFDGALHQHDLNRPLYGATPMQAFTRFFRNYANFGGRASRSEFWWMTLIYFGFMGALMMVGGMLASVLDAGYRYASGPSDAIGALLGLTWVAVSLGTLVPWLAISWRRLHDANLPGPLTLLFFFPSLGPLAHVVFTALPPKVEGRRYDGPRQ